MEELGLPLSVSAPSAFIPASLPKFLPHHVEARRGTLISRTRSYYEDSTFILVIGEPVISDFINLLSVTLFPRTLDLVLTPSAIT